MSINVETLSAAKRYTDRKVGAGGTGGAGGIGLPTDNNGNPDNGTKGQFAVSDGKGGITWETIADAEDNEY